jgi:hypothetical protein
MHSHLGVGSVPNLNGASDTNSVLGITQPWLRSLDGFNTHDEAYTLSISGGVTSANILPGSANAIGIILYLVMASIELDSSLHLGSLCNRRTSFPCKTSFHI